MKLDHLHKLLCMSGLGDSSANEIVRRFSGIFDPERMFYKGPVRENAENTVPSVT